MECPIYVTYHEMRYSIEICGIGKNLFIELLKTTLLTLERHFVNYKFNCLQKFYWKAPSYFLLASYLSPYIQ